MRLHSKRTDLSPWFGHTPRRGDEQGEDQEQTCQATANNPRGFGADFPKKLAEAERRLHEAESKVVELKQEQAAAEEAAKATSDLLLEKKAALAQTAMIFRVAKRKLAEARRAHEADCEDLNKFAADRDVLAHASTNLFPPLKNGTLEPADIIQSTELFMKLIEGRLELDDALSAALPKALVTPVMERNGYTTMVVHEFEKTFHAHLDDLRMRCVAEESLSEARAAPVLSAEQALALADEKQSEAAEVFTEENNIHNLRSSLLNEKKEALHDAMLQLRECESSLAELQGEKDKLQVSEELQNQAKEGPDDAVTAAFESAPPQVTEDACTTDATLALKRKRFKRGELRASDELQDQAKEGPNDDVTAALESMPPHVAQDSCTTDATVGHKRKRAKGKLQASEKLQDQAKEGPDDDVTAAFESAPPQVTQDSCSTDATLEHKGKRGKNDKLQASEKLQDQAKEGPDDNVTAALESAPPQVTEDTCRTDAALGLKRKRRKSAPLQVAEDEAAKPAATA